MRELVLHGATIEVNMKEPDGSWCNFCGEDGKTLIRSNKIIANKRGHDDIADVCKDCAVQIVRIFEDSELVPGQI